MLPARVVAAAAILLCAAHPASARDVAGTVTPAAAVWSSISTPMPRAALLGVLDLDPTLSRALTLVQAVRRLHEDDTRRGTLRARLAAALLSAPRQAEAARRKGPAQEVSPAHAAAAGALADADDDRVPLPLTDKFWENCITKPRKVHGGLATAILMDPRAGLMYVALASTDPDTRLFLAGECKTVSAIARNRAAAFSVVARSVRVRGGRIDPPGGEAALPLWTRLGLPVSDPAEFLTRLVSSDAGRLAYFYDMMAQLDPTRQRFALGLDDAGGGGFEIGAAVYRVCADSDPSWSILDRPFARMAVDVAFVLQQVRLTAEARVAGPGTEAFLSAAFADGDVDRGRDDAQALLGGRTVDAATLVRLVMVPDWIRRRSRLMTLLFAQRVFDNLQPADASDALTALRGIARVETLPFALERIGVRSPAVIASAVRRAQRFGAAATGVVTASLEQHRGEISAFQGSLALIERLVYARVIDTSAATDLIQKLLDERAPDLLGYGAHVARWIEDDVLARVGGRPVAAEPETGSSGNGAGDTTRDSTGDGAADAADDEREDRLLDALAGSSAGPPTLLDWEHARYRVDIASAERARLRAIRRRQGGATLGVALNLFAVARALRVTGGADDLGAITQTLTRLTARLTSVEGPDVPAGVGGDPREMLSGAVRALADARASVGTRVQQARRVADAGSTVLGDVLRSIVYACALGDADGQAFLAGDVSRLHEFGLDELDASRRRVRMWELPADVGAGGQPWHLTGSLLAVDLALSRFALRRALGEMPARQPTLSGPDRRTLVATMALMNPADLSDQTRTTLVDAMRKGREALDAALAGTGPSDDVLGRVGITGWRAQLLRWARAAEPAAVLPMVARSELVWLGSPTPLSTDVRHWGAPTQPIDGAWALRFPGPDATDAVAGRQASAYLPGRFADLTLRLAETMAELHVPAPLTREVLRNALQRFVDEVRPAYPDDWLALVRYADALTRAQVEDYVYGLTVADGPLVPADAPGVQP
jgi:hypothetical protein